jgi:predicted anti-sigma-YlaC factor YlaD
MTCDAYQKLLSAWLDGELSSFEEQALCEHLDHCPICRATWQTTRHLQERIDGLPEPEPPPELWERIERNLASARVPQEEWIVTARGRMLTKTEGESPCLSIPSNRPPLHSRN